MKMNKEDSRKPIDIAGLVNRINLDAERESKQIDWERSVADITRSVKLSKFNRIKSPGIAGILLKLALPASLAILVIGISIGYLMTQKGNDNSLRLMPKQSNNERLMLTKLESTLVRRELGIYFDQAHILIAEIMESCHPEGPDSSGETVSLDMPRVRALLKKNRYFEQDNSDLQWMQARTLLKKIEWLLFEILMCDGELNCEKQQKLQKYISDERLLFKLRLMGNESSARGV